MADEIIGLERAGNGNLGVLFFIPIAAKKAGVIPTPSSELPAGIGTVLGATKVSALDSGDAVFRIDRINMADNSEPPAATVQRLRDKYESVKTKIQAGYVRRYQRYGTKVDA